MIRIILYSTGCPKCSILKKKLDKKHISYEIITDIETMVTLDIDQVPVLSVNGELMQFSEAIKWINEWK